MSAGNAPTKSWQFQGLWPHEIAFFALLGAALYCSQYIWYAWTPWLYRAAFLAALPVLWYRCRDEWAQLPNRGFFLVLAVVWIALFELQGISTYHAMHTKSLLYFMYSDYTSPTVDDQHGMVIPFVVMALVWWKRRELAVQPARVWWPALWLVVLALFFHLAGFMVQQPRLSVIGLFTGFYAVIGLAWGPAFMRAIFFPYVLLMFCMPVGGLVDPITLPLRIMVSTIVATISQFGLAPDVIRQGTQLMDAQRTFDYDVAPACSGMHSLVAMLALAIIYGFVCLKSSRKRLILIASALPLAVLDNVVRLCLTIIVAEMYGQAAGKAVETDFGYLTFAGAFGCVILLGRRLEESENKPVA